jgi:hypothetical protein
MRQKELLFLSIGVFLTMIAIVVNTIYHIQNGPSINREIQPVSIPKVNIDTSIFSTLSSRPE